MTSILMTLVLFATETPVEGDPLSVLLEVYSEDVNDIRERQAPQDERLVFRRQWLDRFLRGLTEYPNSPARRVVMAKSIGLANSVGDLEVAGSLSLQLSADDKSDAGSAFWLIEHGEVSLLLYQSTGDPRHLNEGIASLRKAVTMASDESGNVSPDVRSRAVIGGISLAKALTSSGQADAEEVDAIIRELEDLSTGLPPEVLERLQSSGFGPEKMAVTRIDIAATLRHPTLADQALEQLLALAETGALRSHISAHVLRYARSAWPLKGEEFREFLTMWAARTSDDPWNAYIYFEIVSSAYHDGACEPVIEFGELLLGPTGEALRASNERDMAELYGMMALCYKTKGMEEKAAEFKNRLSQLDSDHHRLEQLNRSDSLPRPWSITAQSPHRSLLIYVNAAILVLVIAYFLIQGLRKFRSNF